MHASIDRTTGAPRVEKCSPLITMAIMLGGSLIGWSAIIMTVRAFI